MLRNRTPYRAEKALGKWFWLSAGLGLAVFAGIGLSPLFSRGSPTPVDRDASSSVGLDASARGSMSRGGVERRGVASDSGIEFHELRPDGRLGPVTVQDFELADDFDEEASEPTAALRLRNPGSVRILRSYRSGGRLHVVVGRCVWTPVAIDGGIRPPSLAALRSLDVVVQPLEDRETVVKGSAAEGGFELIAGLEYSATLDSSNLPIETRTVRFRAPEPIVFDVDFGDFVHVVVADERRDGIVVGADESEFVCRIHHGHGWFSPADELLRDVRRFVAWGSGWKSREFTRDDVDEVGQVELAAVEADTIELRHPWIDEETTARTRSGIDEPFFGLRWNPRLRGQPHPAGHAVWARPGTMLILQPPRHRELVLRFRTKFMWGLVVPDVKELDLDLPDIAAGSLSSEQAADVLDGLGLGSGFSMVLEQRVGGLLRESWLPVRVWYAQGPYLRSLRRADGGIPVWKGAETGYRLRIDDEKTDARSVRYVPID